MKTLKFFSAVFFISFIFLESIISQTSDFDIEIYKQLLQQNQNMSTSQLLEKHSAGQFRGQAQNLWKSALYVVKKLLKKELPSGNYITRWNATNDSGEQVPSGIYFYIVRIGNQRATGKMNLLK